MPELKKVEIETTETPPVVAPPSDRVIDLAVGVGQIQAERENDRRDLMEVKSELSRACALISDMSQALQGLQSQTIRAEERAESAQVTAQAAIVEATTEDESAGGLLEVIPEVETRVEITQKPIKGKSLLQKIFY